MGSMSYMEVEDAHRLENMNDTGWEVSLYVSAITVSVVHQGKGGHGGHDTTNNTNNSNNKNPGNDSNGSINNRNKNKNKNMLEDDEEKMDRKNSFSSTNTNESSSSKKDSSSHGIEHSHRHLIEILNLELDNISVTAEKTNKKFETRVNVSSLQIDNCLRNSEYPVVLVAEQIQNKTDKQKSNKVLSLTLLQNLDDSGDNELTYLELVNIHIAPFSVSVDRALARSIITWANPILLLLDANETEDETNGNGLDDVTDGTDGNGGNNYDQEIDTTSTTTTNTNANPNPTTSTTQSKALNDLGKLYCNENKETTNVSTVASSDFSSSSSSNAAAAVQELNEIDEYE